MRPPVELSIHDPARASGLSDADVGLLNEFVARVSPALQRLARESAAGLRGGARAGSGGADEGGLEHLSPTLSGWTEYLVSGGGDDASMGARDPGGFQPHAAILQRDALFSVVRVALMRLADEILGNDSRPTREALSRALDLGLAMALESCGESRGARASRAAARLGAAQQRNALSTLAAGLAHEIRNPLNGAKLHVAFLERTLRKRGGDLELLDAVDVINGEITRLATLVTEFLAFAHPRDCHFAPTSLGSLCKRAGHRVATRAESCGVTVTLDISVAETSICVDAVKIEQALVHLLTNSVEALAPLGGGLVTLRARHEATLVAFEVEDDGPGLSDPEAPIFDPFFSTKPHGTGLGLSVCRRTFQDHHGQLTVTSSKGRTVFRATMPSRQGIGHNEPEA